MYSTFTRSLAAAGLAILSTNTVLAAPVDLFKLDNFSNFEPFIVGATYDGTPELDPFLQGFDYVDGPPNYIDIDPDPGVTLLVNQIKDDGELVGGTITVFLAGTSPTVDLGSIAVKAGNNAGDPDVFAPFVQVTGTSSAFSILFDLTGINMAAVSNITVVGDVVPPQVVPLPAAVWLFGSALLGVVGIGYRRNRQPA